MAVDEAHTLEERVDEWRRFLRARRAIESADIAELEDHLREEIARLLDAGLDRDEAFLIAVKRIGSLDAVSREFAREHSQRLWKQLVVLPADPEAASTAERTDAIVAWCVAIAAAVAIKLPALLGLALDTHRAFYVRNLALFVLPLLAGYFGWKRRLDPNAAARLALAFGFALVIANAYPFQPTQVTLNLFALHLPIALWLLVGIAYAGGRWNEGSARMDFVRFTGEVFIYYVLIALGGGVLVGFMASIFNAIGIDVEPVFESWLLPCGAVGALVVASWLVEAKQGVIENMAPVLTRLFTPLFAAVLLAFLGTVLWTGRGIDVERGVLIAFDLLLVVVLGLLLYSVSARDPRAPPGWFDVAQVALVVSALLADGAALWAISARIHEFGFTPNRLAALGENLVLLVNLAWSAVLYARFLRGQGTFAALERWQTDYIPVYALWAAFVALAFPPIFGFI